jgi:hypothetical protein
LQILTLHPRIPNAFFNHWNNFFSLYVRTILETKYHFSKKKCAGLGSLPGFSSQLCVCSECNLNTHNFGILRSWPFLYCFLIFLQSFDHATLHVIVSRAKLSFSLGSHHHHHFRYHSRFFLRVGHKTTYRMVANSRLHRGAFYKFLFRWIHYCHSSKSTGKESGKMHLCGLGCYSLFSFVPFYISMKFGLYKQSENPWVQ